MHLHIFRWHRLAAVAMISALVALTPNAGGVSRATAAQFTAMQIGPVLKEAQTNFYINTPSIHESVWNELISEVPQEADADRAAPRSSIEERAAPKDQSTSMLWPAYRYLPHLSYSFSA